MSKHESSTQWETSSFGGYPRLIKDYPNISLSWKVNIDPGKHKDLSHWTAKTLIEIFLFKVKEFGLTKYLMEDAKVKKKGVFYKSDKLCVDKKALHTVLLNVIDREEELKNLFIHYKDVILNSDINIDMPPKDKNQKGEKGDEQDGDSNEDSSQEGQDGQGEGEEEEKDSQEGEGDSEGEGEKDSKARNTSAAEKQWMKDQLDQTRKNKPFRFTYDKALGGQLKENTTFKMMPTRSMPTRYTAAEEAAATRLVKTLDISFDPAADKIKNLKVGKLDVAKIGEVPAGNMNIYYSVEENQTTRPFSVCILADESGSMGHGNRIEMQYSLIKVLYRAFSQIMPAEKIYVYGHSGIDNPEIRIYNDRYNHIFEKTIDGQLHNNFVQNYDGPVIECIYEKIRSYTDDNIIFISLSDGEPGGHGYGGEVAIEEMKRIIEKCKRDGFVTVGIGIQSPHVKEIYNYHSVVNNLSDLVSKTTQVVNSVVKSEFQ